MTESASFRGDPALEQSILQESSILSIFISQDFEYRNLQTSVALESAECLAIKQAPPAIELCESLSIQSIAMSGNSGSLLSPSCTSFIDKDSGDKGTNDDKEYVGYIKLPSRTVHLEFEEDSNSENVPADSTHLALGHASTLSYTVDSHRAYQDLPAYQNIMQSCHDGANDTNLPAVKVLTFAMKNNQPGLGSTNSSASVAFPDCRAGSTTDLGIKHGYEDHHPIQEAIYYLRFTDKFRDTISTGDAIYDDELGAIVSVLEELFEREIIGKNPISFSTIVFSWLDKLLMSLVDLPGRSRQGTKTNFRDIVSLAAYIQRKWQMRFQGKLFSIEKERMLYMSTHGLLADVKMQPSSRGDGIAQWVAETQESGAATTLINLQLGHWWPNTVCALRDGVASFTSNKNVGSHLLVNYVILLKGVETFDPELGYLKYTYEGRLNEVFLNLHEIVGKRIRLIRGFKLRGHNAPKLGIRYDGIHILHRYGLKQIDSGKFLFRVVLHYDSVDGESKVVKDFIKPSTRDDWELYKKIEDAEMKRYCSDSGYHAWKIEEERELKEYQEWYRRELFKERTKKLIL